jgi:hypothetical protein
MYDILQRSRDLRAFEVRNLILSPDNWKNYPNRIQLNWNRVLFREDQAKNVPDDIRGVYSFVVIPDIANHKDCSYLLYIGETTRNFRQRFREYLDIQREGRRRVHIFEMLTNWRENLWFCYAPINPVGLIKDIEDDLLAAYLPPYNRDFPATIRAPIRVLR